MKAPTTETPGRDLIAVLKISRPEVAITVTREEDDQTPWDSEDRPAEDGRYVCYEWTVTATTIRNGERLEASVYLGDSWYDPADRGVAYQEVSGYLQGMVREALKDLDGQLAARAAGSGGSDKETGS